MMNVKSIALIAIAVVAGWATSAPAGTKYAANLVYNGTTDPPPNPTLSPKSSLKVDDKGSIAVSLAGVTDAGGGLVTTSTVYNDSVKAGGPVALDGSEIIVIVKVFVPDVAGLIPYAEVPIPVDLKAGKGKTKLSAAPLFGFLTPPLGRTIEIQGTQVWGPLGAANASACQATVDSSLPVILPPDTTTCRGGTNFAMSGIFVPPPAP